MSYDPSALSYERVGRELLLGTVNDMKPMDPNKEYQQIVVNALSDRDVVSSLVCYGAIPTQLNEDAEPNESLVGRNLIVSFVTAAYNAACDQFPDEKKIVEHCMFRTTGISGLVVDFEERIWSKDSAGAYIGLITGRKQREFVLNLCDTLLAKKSGVTALHKAYLDALLLPVVAIGPTEELNCETLMYITTTFTELTKCIDHKDFVLVREALRTVDAVQSIYARNVLGVIAAVAGIPTPPYMPSTGPTKDFANIWTFTDWSEEALLECRMFKLWIEMANDQNRSGLLISMLIDTYLTWGGSDPDIDPFVENLLENEESLPKPLDLTVPHRAITGEKVLGVNSITEAFNIAGGRITSADYGEISTRDLSGRIVGTVDDRRIVVYFENNEVVVQFKNARNYFLNALYFARPGRYVRTEVRDQVIDRDKLVGLPAIYLLLRGRINIRLARFVVAALTFGAISVKSRDDSAISQILGRNDGKYDYEGPISSSVLAAFPILFDSNKRLYIYHNDKAYRLKCRGMSWRVQEEDMTEAPEGFGKLSSGLPLKAGDVRVGAAP